MDNSIRVGAQGILMWYGDEIIDPADDKYIKSCLSKFERESRKKIIFGSVIGSHSQGLSFPDSDLDVRFLFLGREYSFSQPKDWHIEKKVRFRIESPEERCNTIALWDISAFVNFLAEPYLDSGPVYKLIRNVIWTFGSPLCFDPLDLRIKLLPLINRCVGLESEFSFHWFEMNQRVQKMDYGPSFKHLSHAIYHALSCYWILEKKSLAPIHLCALVRGLFPNLGDWLDGVMKSCNHQLDLIPHHCEIDRLFNFLSQIQNAIEKRRDCNQFSQVSNQVSSTLISEMVVVIREAVLGMEKNIDGLRRKEQIFKIVS